MEVGDGVTDTACIPGSGFDRRDDPNYTAWLEDQYKENLAQKQEEAGAVGKDYKVLAKVLERLDKLETMIVDGAGDKGAHRPLQAPGLGRAVPSAAEFSLSESIKHLSIHGHS